MRRWFVPLLFFAAPALASKVDVDTLYRVYDDGETQVQSPKLDVSTKIMDERATVRAGYASDVVTSASSDVRSFGSKKQDTKIHDVRREYSGTFSMEVEDGSLGWSYINSTENDYKSNIVAFAGTREFFEKNTTLFMAFSYGEDSIGASGDPGSFRPMYNETYSLGVTQVLTKRSVAQLLYDFRVESGYLSSPYRKARVLNADGSISPEAENVPLTRNRHSVAFKYNYDFGGTNLSLANTIRTYFDSWGVTSGTLEERLTWRMGSKFDLALNGRYYTQKEAIFFQDKYERLEHFYTGNKTLSRYDSFLVGLRPTWYASEGFQLYAKYEYYTIGYKNFTDVGRTEVASDDKALSIKAQIVGLGLEGKF